MMEEWNGMEKEEDHPWVFLLDTIKRIAKKKSMDIGFWQSPTSNLNKNTIKKSTI